MLLSSKINEIGSILADETIVVEGVRDRLALNKFGALNIIEISGKSLMEITEDIVARNEKNITILTDFDKDGEQLESQLNHYLSHNGIKINSSARKRVKSLFKIQQIEELVHFTKFMEDDHTGKVSPIYDKIFNRSRIHSRWRGGKTRRHRSDIRTD